MWDGSIDDMDALPVLEVASAMTPPSRLAPSAADDDTLAVVAVVDETEAGGTSAIDSDNAASICNTIMGIVMLGLEVFADERLCPVPLVLPPLLLAPPPPLPPLL